MVDVALTWTGASAAAAAEGGYLATITSQKENDFVAALASTSTYAWLGGSDAAEEGNWIWVEGPEAGLQFWEGGGDGSITNALYANWRSSSNEPNNTDPATMGGDENFLHIISNDGYWNDLPDNGGYYAVLSTFGYVVELSSDIAGSVAANDSDVDNGAVLTFALDAPVAGLTLASDGRFVFNTQDAAYRSLTTGEQIEIVAGYTVSDQFGATDQSTLTITLTGVNDPPLAGDDAFSTNEDSLLSIAALGVLGNDSDVDTGDSISVAEVNGVAADVGTTISLASGALLTLNADGSFDYDPNNQFETLAAGETATDSLSYTISDSSGAIDTATAEITINGVNDAPIAGDDNFSTNEETVLTIVGPGVLNNDGDVDASDAITVTEVNGVTADIGNEIALASGVF